MVCLDVKPCGLVGKYTRHLVYCGVTPCGLVGGQVGKLNITEEHNHN